MSWHLLPDGSTHCDACNAEFRLPASCKCSGQRVTAPAPPDATGGMEWLTAHARAEGLLDRLGVERLLAARVRSADKAAIYYRRRSGKVLERGAVRMGREGPVDADEEKTAQGWDALAESARNRGDKSAGRLYAVVVDRERRADLERRERQAAGVMDRSPRLRPREVA